MSQSQTITLTPTLDTSPLQGQLWNIQRAFRAQMREKRRRSAERIRAMRGLSPMPGWIDADPPTFAFPGWGPRWRPFDFEVDA